MSSVSPFKKRQRAAAAALFVAAAEQVIAEKGYAGATMQDIASRAGCAVGTLYLHFKDKEDLFNALVTRHTHAVIERVNHSVAAAADPLEQLRRRIAALIAYFNEHREFFRIFYAAGVTGRADIAANLRGSALRAYREGKAFETGLVRRAQKAGLVRGDIPASEMIEFIHGVMLVTFARWSMAKGLPPASEQPRVIWRLISGGLGVAGAKK